MALKYDKKKNILYTYPTQGDYQIKDTFIKKALGKDFGNIFCR